MKVRIFTSLLLCVGCASTPKSQPPAETPKEKELVTRQAPPLIKVPKRTAATRMALSESELQNIEGTLQTEADSNELVSATGLKWENGRRTVAVAHVRYPPLDMPESGFETAVDEAALDRCEEQFAGCYEGESTCSTEAHEACVRSAYSDPFVYMSSHLGMDCGIYELSMYDLDDGLRLKDRTVLAEMVCDFDPNYSTPAAKDLDHDGGPELVYVFSHASPDRPDEFLVDSSVIVDANAMKIQYRHTMSAASEEQLEGGVVTGMQVEDENGDSYGDLVIHQVQTRGYCPPVGWALGPDFVTNDEALSEEPPCEMSINRRVVPYDPEEDVWRAGESQERDEERDPSEQPEKPDETS